MDIWENTVLTDKGKALQAKLLQGQTLKITRVTTGAKQVPVVELVHDGPELGFGVAAERAEVTHAQRVQRAVPLLDDGNGFLPCHHTVADVAGRVVRGRTSGISARSVPDTRGCRSDRNFPRDGCGPTHATGHGSRAPWRSGNFCSCSRARNSSYRTGPAWPALRRRAPR